MMFDPTFSLCGLPRALLVAGSMACAWVPCVHADSIDFPGYTDALPGQVHDAPEQALTCMTQAIAYEAGYEPLNGKQAVAEVILNRTHNAGFPGSVCGVVYQGSQRSTGCQFTFTCDGSLRRRLPDWVVDQARAVANVALANQLPRQVGGALNYHADYVAPRWAASMIRVTKIGRHIFYRPTGLSPANGLAISGESELPAGNGEPAASRPVQSFSLWGLGQTPINPEREAIRPSG